MFEIRGKILVNEGQKIANYENFTCQVFFSCEVPFFNNQGVTLKVKFRDLDSPCALA
jgi:hypothetical protein